MIAPDLATMLAFVTTDARVAQTDLQALARDVLAPAFTAITVDGCTSTNDTVLVFASGAAGDDPVEPDGARWQVLASAIEEVGGSLAAQLIRDGEGVGHVLVVEVIGAAAVTDARTVARAVADSPLVKTALFGADPNPGRILQAIGAADVSLDPASVDVWVGPAKLVEHGVIPPAYFAGGSLHADASTAMGEPQVTVRIALGDGPGASRMLGGDLSYEYVRINGEYTT